MGAEGAGAMGEVVMERVGGGRAEEEVVEGGGGGGDGHGGLDGEGNGGGWGTVCTIRYKGGVHQ